MKRITGAEVIGKESRLFCALDETKKELYYANLRSKLRPDRLELRFPRAETNANNKTYKKVLQNGKCQTP